jgi:hypothetical protein
MFIQINESCFSQLLHSGDHLLLGDRGGKPRQEQGRVGRYEAQETRLDPGDRVIHRYTNTGEDAENETRYTSGKNKRLKTTQL